MQIRRYIIIPFLGLIVLTCSCSQNDVQGRAANNVRPPALPRPELFADPSYAQGSDIQVKVRFPASDWDLVTPQKEALDVESFWPWHVRINGSYFRLDGGAVPLFPLVDSCTERASHLQLNSGKELLDPFEWTPGEYRVAYVLRNITVCHQSVPDEERTLDEWASNEVIFRVTVTAEQAAAHGPGTADASPGQ